MDWNESMIRKQKFHYVVERDTSIDDLRMYHVHKLPRYVEVDEQNLWRPQVVETYHVSLGDGDPAQPPEASDVHCTCIGFAMQRGSKLMHKHVSAAMLFALKVHREPRNVIVGYKEVGLFLLESKAEPFMCFRLVVRD